MPRLLDRLVAFVCERNVPLVIFGFHEYARKAAQQLQAFANDVVVAYGMYSPPKTTRKILQSEVNTTDDPVYGIMSRTSKTVEAPYYISQRVAGIRNSVVTFLCDKLGSGPLGEVTPHWWTEDNPLHSAGRLLCYRHWVLCGFTTPLHATFPSGASVPLVQCGARRLENETDHDTHHWWTNEPPDFGHRHRVLYQRVTLTSASVVAQPTTEQKAEVMQDQ